VWRRGAAPPPEATHRDRFAAQARPVTTYGRWGQGIRAGLRRRQVSGLAVHGGAAPLLPLALPILARDTGICFRGKRAGLRRRQVSGLAVHGGAAPLLPLALPILAVDTGICFCSFRMAHCSIRYQIAT